MSLEWDDETCPRCGVVLEGDYNYKKDCDLCDRTVCIDCIALTACQTLWGECKDCYKSTCRVCKKDLSGRLARRKIKMPYLIDDDSSKALYCSEKCRNR